MHGISGSTYRYGVECGNVYRVRAGASPLLEVRNLSSGLWQPSKNASLLGQFLMGKKVLPGGVEEADRIFEAFQRSM